MNTNANKADNRTAHSLLLSAREVVEVRGVTDVISFDEQTVNLSTVCGGMEICGTALHIHVLNLEDGIVTMDGKIDSLTYYESRNEDKNGGFFSKLFR